MTFPTTQYTPGIERLIWNNNSIKFKQLKMQLIIPEWDAIEDFLIAGKG